MQRSCPMPAPALTDWRHPSRRRKSTRADHGVDFVDEQDGVGMRLEFLENLLQPLLEIAR